MSTKIILLFSLALDDTYAVFEISFATGTHALGKHTGPDIFHFVVFFIDKIKKLKEEFSVSEEDDPISELKKYLSKKSIPREGFSLKELNDEDVEKLLKQMKVKKLLGLDWNCGFSLKLSSEC